MKKTELKLFSILFLFFCMSIFLFHSHGIKKADRELEKVSVIVAESLWNFDRESSGQYLKEIMQRNHYHHLVITDMDGQIFVEINQLEEHKFEGILLELNLIPHTQIAQPILFKNTVIGSLEVIWVNTSLYMEINFFVLFALLLVIVHLYNRILAANRNLEGMVEERTADLLKEREKLKESETRLKTLVENSPVAIAVSTPEDSIVYFNNKFIQLFGYSKTDINMLEDWFVSAYPDEKTRESSRKEWHDIVQEYFITGVFKPYTATVWCKDGSNKDIEFNFVAIGDFYITSFLDVTEQNRARMALVKEKDFSKYLIDSMPGIFFLYKLERDKLLLSQWNKNHETILGFSAGDLEGAMFNSFFQEEDIPLANKIVSKLIKREQIKIEIDLKNKDGDLIPFYLQAYVFENAGDIYCIGTGIDLTEKHHLQKQLYQSQKMEAIGTLAGGIAHDFNNILSAIYGYTELAREDVENPDALVQDLERIMEGAERAKNLVRQILTFSRKTDQEKKALQISLVIKEALKLLRSSIPTTIEIRQSIVSELLVLADPTQIHQVIMNLCTNAYHAMRESGGTLDVALKEIEISEREESHELKLLPGRYLQLEISDTGTGMEEETRSKIFDPYFTTKGIEEGTGLGLAVVHGIVESYGGRITVFSEPGRGTTFFVYLPVYEGESDEVSLKEQETILVGGNETIMLVDDDNTIIKVGKRMLSEYGYEVYSFTNGVQAYQELKRNPDKFDLIITDMTMPYMTGADLARKALEICPALPLILCSGHSELINREKALAMGIREYCAKPLNKKQLLHTIRKVLDIA